MAQKIGKQRRENAAADDHARITTDELAREFPTLRLVVEDNKTYLNGSFPIGHEGEVLDQFDIEMLVAPLAGNELPEVRETGGRIPRIADRHVNADGTACITLPESYFLRNPGPFDLLKFLSGPVRDYFIGQALVERGDDWPHQEWPHGIDGLLLFYEELLGTDNLVRIREYLRHLARAELRGHWACPCGSGKKLRRCHQQELAELRARIGFRAARRLLALLDERIRTISP